MRSRASILEAKVDKARLSATKKRDRDSLEADEKKLVICD